MIEGQYNVGDQPVRTETTVVVGNRPELLACEKVVGVRLVPTIEEK